MRAEAQEEAMNALLDGELSPSAAAEAARALAENPAAAARFAALARLRAVTAALDEGEAVPALPAGRAAAGGLATLLAGPVLAVMLGAALTAGWVFLRPGTATPVEEAHRRFLGGEAAAMATAYAPPDLSMAGMRLETVLPVGGGVYAGYVGPRGCRLGVWSGPEGAAPPERAGDGVRRMRGDGGSVLWIAADPGMDRERFAALARAVDGSGPVLAGLGGAPCRA